MNRPTGSGSLNQKITIVDRQSLLDDTNGSKVFNDDTVIAKKVWCSVKYIGTPSAGASEDREELQRTGKVKIEAKMRYREDIKHDDVVVFMGGLFDIYSIQERGRDEFIVIRAESRDDDTYRIAISDAYSEDFYLQYPNGVEDPEATEEGAIRGLDNALVRYGDATSPMYIERTEISDDQLNFDDGNIYFEIPIEWFNDIEKSGKENSTQYSNKMKLAYVDDPDQVLHDIWPDKSIYDTFNDINTVDGLVALKDGIRIPYSSNPVLIPYIFFSLDLNPGYRYDLPLPWSLLDTENSIPHTDALFGADFYNLNEKMICVTYKKSYVDPIDYTGQEVTPKLAYYTPVIALRPYMGNQLQYTEFLNPSAFGRARAEIYISGGIYTTPNLISFGSLSASDIPVLKRNDIPFVDFTWGNVRRHYTAGSIKEYNTLNQDLSRDFTSYQNIDDGLSVLDYWNVVVEDGTEAGTYRLKMSLRYGAYMGGVPYTVTDNQNQSINFYAVNMHHRFASDGHTDPDTYNLILDFLNHYSSEEYINSAPEGWDIKGADDQGYATSYPSTNYYVPNVALEDLYIRIKNPRIIVNKLNLPDNYQDGDDLVYEEVEYKIEGYEIDPITGGFVSSSTAQNNHLNQFYVYDNIPSEVRDEKQATCVFKFDVEYDLKHFVEPDSMFIMITNDRNFTEPPEDDQYWGENFSQIIDSANSYYAQGVMEAQNLFPFTVTHQVKVRDANG